MNIEAKEEGKVFLDISNVNGMNYFEEGLKAIGMEGKIVNELCQYVLNSGGKRLRAVLTLSSGQMINKLNLDMVFSAIAVELIHAASLVHDDVIDKARMRRGRETISSKLGNHSAVLTGDYLFAEAFHTLSKIRCKGIMNIVINSIKEMCDGEIAQYKEKFNWNVSEENYMSRIYKKTASLISSSCQIGSIAANAKPSEVLAMKNYGNYLGYAFQIVDDMLDFTGSQRVLGKPVGNDLRQGEITLPVIYLISKSQDDSRLKSIISKSDNKISIGDIEYIEQKIVDRGISQKVFERAQKLIKLAKNEVADFPQSEYKRTLINIADAVLDRNY